MSLYDECKRFSDVHPNIILKTDMARQGTNVSPRAAEQFKRMDDIACRGYHMFSYDRQETRVYAEKIPGALRLDDGCTIQIETNMKSPYVLDFKDGEFFISENNEPIAKGISFFHRANWYGMKLEDGTPMEAICQGMSGHDMFIVFNNYCELWNTNDQCLFCNINATLRDQRAGGEAAVARKSPEALAEVLATALAVDIQNRRFIIVSGGTILGKYKGQTELEFFCSRLEAMRGKVGACPPLSLQIGAQNDDGWKRIHDTGAVTSIEPNMEVWDRRLFEWICPGKAKYVGYDEWIKRTIRAVDFWGPRMVTPNFVLGVEMARPHGFEDVGTAVKSIAGGWDFLMSHGVLPRHRFWFIEKGSALGDQEPPPLEYYIEAQKAYAELRWKHNLEIPFGTQMGNRDGYTPSCQPDWEYYHGSGTLSRQKLEERGYQGISAYDKVFA